MPLRLGRLTTYELLSAAVAGLSLLASACPGAVPGPETTAPGGSGSAPPAPSRPAPVSPAAIGPCLLYEPGRTEGRVESDQLLEISGIVASRRQPGVFWAHNDSGDRARVLALTGDGRHLGEVVVTDVEALDIEDIGISPGPDADLLYLGDIGDNLRARQSIVVFRFEEPAARPSGVAVSVAVDDAQALRFVYPDGAHDAEALLVDPATADLFVITKELGGPALVYRAAAPHAPGPAVELERVAELPMGTPDIPVAFAAVTAADVSPDGRAVLLRTYLDVVLLEGHAGEHLAAALCGPAHMLPQRLERQGEAIAFAHDGRSYVTVSEGAHPAIHRFSAQSPCR